MKNILIIVFTFFIGLQLIAQEKVVIQQCDIPFKEDLKVDKTEQQKDENYIYTLVQQKAQPKEGFPLFYEHFVNEFNRENLPSPKVELICRVRFVVEKDGTFSDIEILQDNDGIGEEAVRILKTMPKWNPAQHNGEVVRSRFTLPIKIRTDKNLL